jgi:mannose-6-phosphate isomerase-like protein (cupin superfamily)
VRITSSAAPAPFTTKDGSTVQELAHPRWSEAARQSVAEARVPPKGETLAHRHPRAEEIYYFASGRGRMRLGDEEGAVAPGDCVVIPPGVVHKLWNTGAEPLVVLCCSAPAYSHEDTELLEPGADS